MMGGDDVAGAPGLPHIDAQRTSKPSGSSSARIMAPTAVTPSRFKVPLF